MSTKSPIGPAWFWVALQALIVLANADDPCSSATIAQDLKTHAVFLRRVMAQLVRAEIVEAREGRDGGYRLARPASEITLADIFQIIKTINQGEEQECIRCSNSAAQIALDNVRQDLERSNLEVLSRYTLSSLIQRPQ